MGTVTLACGVLSPSTCEGPRMKGHLMAGPQTRCDTWRTALHLWSVMLVR